MCGFDPFLAKTGHSATSPVPAADRCPLLPFGLPKFALQDSCPVAQKLEMVGPVLHHAHAFVPILATGVGSTDGIVRELPLDRVSVPQAISLSSVAAIARKPCPVIWS